MFGFAKQITKVISIFPYALFFFLKSEIFEKKTIDFSLRRCYSSTKEKKSISFTGATNSTHLIFALI